jgi:hypothetical protein
MESSDSLNRRVHPKSSKTAPIPQALLTLPDPSCCCVEDLVFFQVSPSRLWLHYLYMPMSAAQDPSPPSTFSTCFPLPFGLSEGPKLSLSENAYVPKVYHTATENLLPLTLIVTNLDVPSVSCHTYPGLTHHCLLVQTLLISC